MTRFGIGLLALLALVACSDAVEETTPPAEQLLPDPPSVERLGPYEVIRFSRDPTVDGEDSVGFEGVIDVEEGTRCLTLINNDGGRWRWILAIPRDIEVSVEADGSIVGSFGVLLPGDSVGFGVSAVGGLAPGETITCDATTTEILWTSPNGWGRRFDPDTGLWLEPRRR